MDLLLRAVEHLSVGTLELLHQLRKKRVFLSPVFIPILISTVISFRSKMETENKEEARREYEIHDPLDPRMPAN